MCVYLGFKYRNRLQSLHYCRPLRWSCSRAGDWLGDLCRCLSSLPFYDLVPVLAGRKKWTSCCVTTTQASSHQTRLEHALEFPPQNTLAWPGLQGCPTHDQHSSGSALFLSYTSWERIILHVLLSFTKILPLYWLAPGLNSSSCHGQALLSLRSWPRFTMAMEKPEVRSLQAATYQCSVKQRHILGSLSK